MSEIKSGFNPSPNLLLCVLCAVLVAQLCLALCDPMDYSPPGSSVHGDSPGKNAGVGCHAFLHGIWYHYLPSCSNKKPRSHH